jgi:putative thioredoxin
VLGPALERVANEKKGSFVLAKVNVDENPALSRRFDVRGIPMVLAFRDGRQVDSFTGALPESQVRAWLNKLVPSGADALAAEAVRLEATDPPEAARRYRRALEQEPGHPASLIGLGRVLTLLGDPEASELLRSVPAGNKAYTEAQSLLALGDFLRSGEATEADGGPDPRYLAAAVAARKYSWEQSLQQLLEIVRRDGVASEGGIGDQARRAMLAIFTLLGDSDPLTQRYRRSLANALF